jgi:hypothetical protein
MIFDSRQNPSYSLVKLRLVANRTLAQQEIDNRRLSTTQGAEQDSRLVAGNDEAPQGSSPQCVQTGAIPMIDREATNVMHAPNSLVSGVMRTVISSGDDALGILFKAAEGNAQSSADNVNQAINLDNSAQSSTKGLTPGTTRLSAVSPASTRHRLPDATSSAMDIWRVCRFVKQGWFSASEAILLVDL